jgi:hypothetical protein
MPHRMLSHNARLLGKSDAHNWGICRVSQIVRKVKTGLRLVESTQIVFHRRGLARPRLTFLVARLNIPAMAIPSQCRIVAPQQLHCTICVTLTPAAYEVHNAAITLKKEELHV